MFYGFFFIANHHSYFSAILLNLNNLNIHLQGFVSSIWDHKINERQAGAGAVPSSGLVNSLVKIEFFFLLEIENKTHDEF